MLQQTQVVTVVAYFERFIRALPTIADLAAAPEEKVLHLWEGLGYYRRARQLHRAAQEIVREYNGEFPRDAEAVRKLPGIGRYTAGAILSIAFDAREPILEANTYRLLSRLLAFRGDPRGKEGESLLWHFAAELLPARRAGLFNQALMELGATICTPRAPVCPDCPVMTLCPTFVRGLQDEIPRAMAKPKIEAVHEASIVVRRRGKVLLWRRGATARWAGLWDFPRFALDATDEAGRELELVNKAASMTGLEIVSVHRFATLKHGVTRFRITLDCRLADHRSGKARGPNGDEVRWVKPSELKGFPLSVTGRKIAGLVEENARNRKRGAAI